MRLIPILVPYIGLGLEKRRLAWALSPRERSSLAREMLEIVVATIRAVPGAAPIVVSPDSAVEDNATRLGARFICQHGIGLNQALEEARDQLRLEGYATIGVLHADLPFLQPSDVEALFVAMPARGLVVAPDVAGIGTNGLYLNADDRLPFRFGPGSHQRFRGEAGDIGLTVASVERHGLAFDLDNLDALRRFRGVERPPTPLVEVG